MLRKEYHAPKSHTGTRIRIFTTLAWFNKGIESIPAALANPSVV
jgi:hypothetical protein